MRNNKALTFFCLVLSVFFSFAGIHIADAHEWSHPDATVITLVLIGIGVVGAELPLHRGKMILIGALMTASLMSVFFASIMTHSEPSASTMAWKLSVTVVIVSLVFVAGDIMVVFGKLMQSGRIPKRI